MKITHDQVHHVANLARLEIADENVEAFARQLGSILEYVELLNSVETRHVTAASHAIDLCNVMREDEVRLHLNVTQGLANAPSQDENCFRVPRIIG